MTFGSSAIFFLSVPVALAALVAARVSLPEIRERQDAGIDFAGAALATAGLALLVFGLTSIDRYGALWPGTLLAISVALAMLAAFVVRQRTARQPLISPALLRLDSLKSAIAGMPGLDFGFNAAFLIGLLYLQQGRGLSPLAAGLAIAPLGLAAAVGGPLSARLLRRYRSSRVAALGLTLAAAGLLPIQIIPGGASYGLGPLIGFLVAGLGIAMAAVALTSQGGSDVPAPQKGMAYGMLQASTHLAGAVAVASLTTIGAIGAGANGDVGVGFGLAFIAGAIVVVASAAGVLYLDRDRRDENAAAFVKPG
jgi:hypothetical protein